VAYLAVVTLAAALLLLFFLIRERRWRRRDAVIRGLLDSADALETQLQQCRRRMQAVRGMLEILPEEMSATAASALSADNKFQAALKDLLGHRLWIKQHGDDATPAQLDAASSALAQSSTMLGAQLARLEEIATDLERAQSEALAPGRRRRSP
jgi:hypothetical protein